LDKKLLGVKGFSSIASTEIFVAGDLAESLGSLSKQYWLATCQTRHDREVVKRTRSRAGRGTPR
jgi:hypothetical protein